MIYIHALIDINNNLVPSIYVYIETDGFMAKQMLWGATMLLRSNVSQHHQGIRNALYTLIPGALIAKKNAC